MRIAIFGNSGSGKSTEARRLADEHDLPTLELDRIVWEPGQIATLRDSRAIQSDLRRFLDEHDDWVVEGCYGELVTLTLASEPELLFLNPGLEACIANSRRRPWEPHKYASKEEQDEMLENLIDWIRGYHTRDDAWSLVAHRRIFDAYDGPKREFGRRPG
jgi:adenylate kinase family enzyme